MRLGLGLAICRRCMVYLLLLIERADINWDVGNETTRAPREILVLSTDSVKEQIVRAAPPMQVCVFCAVHSR